MSMTQGKRGALFLSLFLLLASVAIAHPSSEEAITSSKESLLWYDPLLLVIIVCLWLFVSTFTILCCGSQMTHQYKKFFFLSITIPVAMVTLYLAGHTLYENAISVTGGPVHWHADYQVWHCGERIDLVDPNFPSNKIGTPLLHEHDDDRVHMEGTVVNWDEAT